MERIMLRTIRPEFRDSLRPARVWSNVRGSSAKGMSVYRSAMESKRWNLHFVQNGASNGTFKAVMISCRRSSGTGDSESHGSFDKEGNTGEGGCSRGNLS
jgi:hypothetical protein